MNLTNNTSVKVNRVWLLLFLFVTLTLSASTAPLNKNISIMNFLSEGGTLNIPAEFTGSLDLSGYSVVMDECEGLVATPSMMTNEWSALGLGLNQQCRAIAVGNDGSVYAAGLFTLAGGQPANRIAKWDGSSWSALGPGFDNFCNALVVATDGTLYAGGAFTQIGSLTVNCIARWNGSSWSALGPGLNHQCSSVAIASDGTLYAGGAFTQAGWVSANRIARWDGFSWSSLGSGMNNSCNALAVAPDGTLYAGGAFNIAGGTFANKIAKWNGSSWSTLGTGLAGDCTVLAIGPDGHLYAGGGFGSAGGISASRVAKWNGSSWSGLGSGLSGGGLFGVAQCHSLAFDASGNLYVSGIFNSAGGNSAKNIAKWDGSNWSALGSGLSGSCSGLAVDNNGHVYAGGFFAVAGGTFAKNIAKWTPAPPCDLEISSVDVADVTCNSPGSITINASCTSCSGVLYSINGGASTQLSNTFTGLTQGFYIPYVKDNGDDSCNEMGALVNIALMADTEAPTANCPPSQTANNIASQCGANVNFTIPSPTDNCSNVTAVANPVSGSFFTVGTTPVTVTATDAAGNTANCSFNVIVNDTEAPTANCPNTQTVNNTTGQCGANVNFTIPSPTDNCTGVMATANPASGSFFTVGTNPVTVTATDGAGNTATCSFNVIVNDTEAPTANCPNTQTVNNTTGQCGANVSFTIPSPTDNCTGVTATANPASSTFFNVGTNPVTVTATDAAGNTAICIFSVIVNDTEAPNMVCNNFTLMLTNTSTLITTAQLDGGSTDNCTISNLSLNNNTFTCATLGAQSVVLTGTDAAGNSSSCTATITVQDNNTPTALCTNPTVNLSSDGTTTVDASFFDGGSSVDCGSLNYTASMTDFDCSDVGNTYTIMLTVTSQSSGQSATCNSTVTVADPNSYCCAPANAVCNNTTVNLGADGMGNITPSDVGSGSTADCGLMAESVSQMDFDCYDIGTPVTVTYTITDINGASSSCLAVITVEDNISPVPVCKTTMVELQADGNYTLQQSDAYDANLSTDNCSIDQISFPSTTYSCINKNQVFTIPVTVTDAGGNSVSCNATITVDVGNGLPNGWTSYDIGDTGTMGNSTSFDPCSISNTGEFIITGGGNNSTSSTTDNAAFVGQTICGDGTITAKIENVDPNGYGGLMIRETAANGAKQVSIFSNMSNILRHETRYTTNGIKQVNSFFKPSPIWLRLQRQGNWIFAYYSVNGIAFQYVHAVLVPMQSCVEFGMASFTYLPGQQTTAIFSNVIVTGASMSNMAVPFTIENSVSEESIDIFPNPASDQITLRFNGMESPVTLNMHDQYGRKVLTEIIDPNSYRLNLDLTNEHLNSGVYYIDVKFRNGKHIVKRLVITE